MDFDQFELTRIIHESKQGDSESLELLYNIVYSELKRIARIQKKKLSVRKALETTEVVHEMYLKVTRSDGFSVANRNHFFSVLSMAARQIVIDDIRKRGRRPEALEEEMDQFSGAESGEGNLTLLSIDQALGEIEKDDEASVRVFEAKFFAGLTDDQIAEASGLSTRSVQRKWNQVRGRLSEMLS